jgi:hypothetical protein
MENQKQKKRRTKLFGYLDAVIRVSDEKINSKGNADRQKQGWARVLVSAVSAYGQILKDVELEEIMERLEKLETERELEKVR